MDPEPETYHPTPTAPKPRISRINIGRLYNLGNYEHERFELTIDIPEGASAQDAIIGAERILAGLKPMVGIKEPSELRRMRVRLDEMRNMTEQQIQTQYGSWSAPATKETIIRRHEVDLDEEIEKRRKAIKKQEEARALFDDLCGAAKWVDAKLSWDNDDTLF